MAKEIERKFLVNNTSFKPMASGSIAICQGYLSSTPESTVRIRIAGDRGFITVKGITRGASRSEWEYPVPVSDAREMLDECCRTVIDKTRYFVPFEGHTWEVDVFGNRLSGLMIAEVELDSEKDPVALPPFVGREVTDDKRYYNSALAGGVIPPFD